MTAVPLPEQIAAVAREVEHRRKAYPYRIARMIMAQDVADMETAAMQAALATLQWVQRHRDRLLAMAPELRETQD